VERVLVTGAAGFTGRHLIRFLKERLSKGTRFYGVDRTPVPPAEGLQFSVCDLTDSIAVYELTKEVEPSRIFHLSGSFSNEINEDYTTNVLTSRNLLDAVKGVGSRGCRVLIVGSAAEYGYVEKEGEAVAEDYPMRPVSIYGLTKTFQTSLAQFYARVHGLHVVIVRPFNLIGYGISSRLFIGSLCEQIAGIIVGHSQKISLGDVSGARDYIDVGDAVRAYYFVLEHGKIGDLYNVGSGRLTSIRHLTELILSSCGIDSNALRIRPANYRPSDNSPSFCADISKMRALGWAPRVSIEASIHAISEHILSGSGKTVG
jgi:GDP-4-dehydro-6-deoxy-D-mannose reductase